MRKVFHRMQTWLKYTFFLFPVDELWMVLFRIQKKPIKREKTGSTAVISFIKSWIYTLPVDKQFLRKRPETCQFKA